MTLQNLQAEILSKSTKNLYIFVGDEPVIEKLYINKIADSKNVDIEYLYSYKDLPQNGLILLENKLYVILYDDEILSQESFWMSLLEANHTIILKFISLDGRSKFFKQFEDNIVIFDTLPKEIAINHLQEALALDAIDCGKLLSYSNSYTQALLEADKILNYKNTILTPTRIFFELDEGGAFHKYVEDDIFKFIDSILLRDKKTTVKLYAQQKDENCIKLIALLYNSFKTVLLIQSCKSNDISKTTGLSSAQIYYNKDKINYYNSSELVDILRLLQKVDVKIKTGEMDSDIALDYLLVNIL